MAVIGRTKPADFEGLSTIVSTRRLSQIKAAQIDFPRIAVSSSELRRRVAAGQSIRYQTPRAVEKYIETHNLYR